ncbi:hypothetical protein [Faecalimonas sp.]
MVKLILYEWEKLWKNASVLKIVFLFLVLSGIVFQGELNRDKEEHQPYLEFHKAMDNMTEEEAIHYLRKEKERSGYEQYKAISYLEDEISTINGYEAYRKSIQTRYKQNQSISVFSKNKEQNQYMERIAKKYENLKIKAPMKRQPYQGFLKVVDFYVHYILAIVLLIYLVSVVFIQEQRNGKADFARTMFRGDKSLFIAKSCTVYGALLLYLLGTFLIHIGLAGREYGFISIDAAIQSVPGFYSVPYAWNIGTYVIAYIGLQGLAAFLLVAIAIFLARWSTSELKTTLGLTIIMGWSVFSQNTMNGEGIESFFRIWNIWGSFTGESILKNYEILKIGNIFIEQSLWIPICIILSIFLLLVSGKHCPKERKKTYFRKEKRKKNPHGLFYYEMKKMWIYQGGIFLFVACMGIQAITIYQYKTYIGTDEVYYQKYIDEFGNRITTETENKIAAEKIRLKNLENELNQTEDPIKMDNLTQQLECVGGFHKYVERIENLLEDEKTQLILKDRQYDLLFENTVVSRMMIILLCVSFAFLIPVIYQKEKETGMEVLQDTSWTGGKKIWRLKIGIVLLYSIPFILCSEGMVVAKENYMYDLEWFAPVGCLPQYWENHGKTSIGVAFLIGFIIQCIVVSIIVMFLSACAKKVRNQHMLTGIILGLTVVPVILSSHVPVAVLSWGYNLIFVFTAQFKIVIAGCGILGIVTYLIRRKENR